MSYKISKAYAKFNRKINGRINHKGNFVPFPKEEKLNEKSRNLRSR